MHAVFLMNAAKVQTSKVSSQDLYWENKIDKRKRSIATNPENTNQSQIARRKQTLFTFSQINDLQTYLHDQIKETTDQGRGQRNRNNINGNYCGLGKGGKTGDENLFYLISIPGLLVFSDSC